MIDSTIVRAHQQAVTGKAAKREALVPLPRWIEYQDPFRLWRYGSSLALGLGRRGEINDCTQAAGLLVGIKAEHVLVDRTAMILIVFLGLIHQFDAHAVIPRKANRKVQRDYDREL